MAFKEFNRNVSKYLCFIFSPDLRRRICEK
jgi:hypothetical protein